MSLVIHPQYLLTQLVILRSIHSVEELLCGVADVVHDFANPDVARFGLVDVVQLLPVRAEFGREIHPATVIYVSLPSANVGVSYVVVQDAVRHPVSVQSGCLSHVENSFSNFGDQLGQKIISSLLYRRFLLFCPHSFHSLLRCQDIFHVPTSFRPCDP